MAKLRRTRLFTLTIAALLAVSGAALASEHENEPAPGADTLLNVGFDTENQVLIANSSATDSPYDCTLQDGPLVVGYGAGGDGILPVDTVTVESTPGVFSTFTFENRPEDQVDTDSFAPAGEPIPYAGADGDCGLTGAPAAGPNGQINHGQVMKAFHQVIEGRGMGCLNRIVAQSDLGKGDQQLRASDADPDFASGPEGMVEFLTIAATCEKGKKDDHPGGGANDPNGPGKANADKPRGSSANAPGRNK